MHTILILMIVPVLLLTAGCTQSAENSAVYSSDPAITMNVPVAPVPVKSSGGMNLAYELELSPLGDPSVKPDMIEVIDPATGMVLYSLEGDLLSELWHPASDPPPSAEEIKTFTGKIPLPRISLWFVVRQDRVPDRLVHKIILNRSATNQTSFTLTGGDTVVRKDEMPVVIGSPVRGDGWIAIETTSPKTHHFKSQITMNGATRVPQRYAQDWILADPATGKVASGNITLAKNFFGYGKEIYSVANGTVVDIYDGLPDIKTIYSTPPANITTAAGNYVIVDIGDGKYACFGHMIPGSIRVSKGEHVTEGQVIGLVGNSGNSDVPHLHFHVVTGTPSFLGAEGYPHAYRSFAVIGRGNQTRVDELAELPDFSGIQFWEEYSGLVTLYKEPVPREEMLPDIMDLVQLP